ncbi:hypothetical protein [Enterovirga rhinocerotis]|uniref:Uncharacterized protein n=1 Tax=Enterovirga rhinocerotis TaxID=1339210 RepID=A0A4R7BYI4_9HYPH|nr:hypothetical protein [Enterovirga rhinocerotis]TDR90332.1 hypothetical protein EV668_3182 [Enterovirga rhinocerotis]
MSWRAITEDDKDGRRLVVAGGTYVRGNRLILPQLFPSMVAWDGQDWLICDNEGEKAVIRNPKRALDLPEG